MRYLLLSVLAFTQATGCNKGAAPARDPAPEKGDISEPAQGSCASVAATECGARSDCAEIKAARASGDGKCMEPPKVVGCMDGDQACGDAITYATDPDGAGWWFMDTCVPKGWTSAPYPDGEVPPTCGEVKPPGVRKATKCEDLEATTKRAIAALDRSCDSDTDCTTTEFGCPFGCSVAIRKGADTSHVERKAARYFDMCGRCKYKCPSGEQLRCVEKRCSLVYP